MIFNYKRLNDITNKDQYSIPEINTILQKVSTSSIYSKFDLKSGFHQIAMHPNSIEWTAFWVQMASLNGSLCHSALRMHLLSFSERWTVASQERQN